MRDVLTCSVSPSVYNLYTYAIPERALEGSKGDVCSQEARARDEDAVIEDSSLKESHEQVRMSRSVWHCVRISAAALGSGTQ